MRRRDPSSHETLIALGRRALEEIAAHHHPSEASLVFEDALREFAPETERWADLIQQQRGYSGERLHIRQAVEYLEKKPVEDAVTRAEARIAKMLSRAWKAGVITRNDEDYMPILRYLPNHIRHGIQLTQRGWGRAHLQDEITNESFRLRSRRAPAAQLRLAKRIADVMYEEGSKLYDPRP